MVKRAKAKKKVEEPIYDEDGPEQPVWPTLKGDAASETTCPLTMEEHQACLDVVVDKSLTVDYSLQTGRPVVSFIGKWSKKEVRTAMGAIAKQYHQSMAQERKSHRMSQPA